MRVCLFVVLLGCSHEASAPKALTDHDKTDAIFAPVERIQAAYRDNEVKAERTYKGKVVQLRGTVAAVKKSPVPAVILDGEGAQLQATFDTMDVVDENNLAALRPGVEVTLYCLNTGTSNGVPELVHCIF